MLASCVVATTSSAVSSVSAAVVATVSVQPVADLPQLAVEAPMAVQEDGAALALNVSTLTLQDGDGSETLSLTLRVHGSKARNAISAVYANGTKLTLMAPTPTPTLSPSVSWAPTKTSNSSAIDSSAAAVTAAEASGSSGSSESHDVYIIPVVAHTTSSSQSGESRRRLLNYADFFEGGHSVEESLESVWQSERWDQQLQERRALIDSGDGAYSFSYTTAPTPKRLRYSVAGSATPTTEYDDGLVHVVFARHFSGSLDFELVATATETSLSDIADSDAMSNSTSATVRGRVIAVADTPRLVVTESARGDEDSAIPISVTTLDFPDDSSDHLLILSCVAGQLAAVRAANTPLPRSAQADGFDYFLLNMTLGSVSDTSWKMLTVTPAHNFAGNMSLNVTARAVERSSNDVAQNTTQVKLSVAAVADAPFISIGNAEATASPQTSSAWISKEDTVASIALQSLRLNDTDGSEALALVFVAPCGVLSNVTLNGTAMMPVSRCNDSSATTNDDFALDLGALALLGDDDDDDDDDDYSGCTSSFSNQLAISEVADQGTTGACGGNDWIEIVNTGSTSIDLDGYTIEGRTSKILNGSMVVGAGEYVVLCFIETDAASAPCPSPSPMATSTAASPVPTACTSYNWTVVAGAGAGCSSDYELSGGGNDYDSAACETACQTTASCWGAMLWSNNSCGLVSSCDFSRTGFDGSVYQLVCASPSSAPTRSSAPTSLALTGYIGCYGDGAAGYSRALDGSEYTDDNSMTAALCYSLCQADGYTYYGTEFGSQCFCGDSYDAYGESTACTMACTGDADEVCGGDRALSVYGPPSTLGDTTLDTTYASSSCAVDDEASASFFLRGNETISLLDAGGACVASVTLPGQGVFDSTFALSSDDGMWAYTQDPTAGSVNNLTASTEVRF